MADDPNKAAREQQLAAQREASEQSRKEAQERLSKGKPTPTQDENDRAKLGEHVLEKEDDGSGPDPHNKAIVAERGPGYQTRAIPRQPVRSPSTEK